MSEHLQSLGALALGSRLRAVSDRLFAQGDVVYQRQGLNVSARWYPVLALLAREGPLPITGIARATGLSHPYVIAITRKMAAAGYLDDARDPADERRRLVHLNPAGRDLLCQLEPVWDRLREVVSGAFQRIGVDLVDALGRFEADLERHPWPDQMARRFPAIQIVDFAPQYAEAFRRLNVEWLERYFRVEAVDLAVLDAPVKTIIEPGGAILFARDGDEIVGTCALRHEGGGVYELTKMGVTAHAQGHGAGAALLRAAIDRFVALGGGMLYLETNSVLAPAIRLYQRFGFVDQGHRKPGSVYERSNVYMIWSGDAGAASPDP